MTQDKEFEGKSVEHAVEEACRQLGVNKEDLKYDVLSYGSTGIFGLVGAKKARIRVHAASIPEIAEEIAEEIVEEVAEETAEPAAEQDGEALPQEDSSVAPLKTPVHEDEIIEQCRASLSKIVDSVTDDAVVTVEKAPEQILFHIQGGNPAVLIGKRGQTLEAIQYLIEKIANRQNEQKYRIQVDVEGYLQNRRDNLERLALRLAEKAVRTGKPMSIGQMSSGDRRIVHMALKDQAGVRTQSAGEGLYRKLMILPKKKIRSRRPETDSKETGEPE